MTANFQMEGGRGVKGINLREKGKWKSEGKGESKKGLVGLFEVLSNCQSNTFEGGMNNTEYVLGVHSAPRYCMHSTVLLPNKNTLTNCLSLSLSLLNH